MHHNSPIPWSTFTQYLTGLDVVVPEEVLLRAEQISYKSLSFEELSGLVDTVKNIEHLARLKNKLLGSLAKKDFQAAKEELIASVVEHEDLKKPVPIDKNTMNIGDKVASELRKMDASLLKMEQVIDWLDGGDVKGAWTQMFWKPIAEAQHAENDLTLSVTKELATAFENLAKDRKKTMQDKFFIPHIGQNLTRQSLIAAALNTGNLSNLDKMMRGHNWTSEQVNAMLSHLTTEDWVFVQNAWDVIGKLWEPIAALEKRITGLEPEKVEHRSFTVQAADGQMVELTGGYYPLVYDARTQVGKRQELGASGSLFEEGYEFATTNKGHTKARTGFAAPLNLDLNVIPSHVAKVVHDITHREALMNANKIINDTDVRQTLQNRLGVEYADMFMPWLRGVANDRSYGNQQGLGFWTRFMAQARTNTTVVAMGFKATTATSQIAGLSQTLDMVKSKYLMKELAAASASPMETLAWV